MVVVVFEQKHEWEESKSDSRKHGPKRPNKVLYEERFVVKDWLLEVEENIEKIPVAGNFYGV